MATPTSRRSLRRCSSRSGWRFGFTSRSRTSRRFPSSRRRRSPPLRSPCGSPARSWSSRARRTRRRPRPSRTPRTGWWSWPWTSSSSRGWLSKPTGASGTTPHIWKTRPAPGRSTSNFGRLDPGYRCVKAVLEEFTRFRAAFKKPNSSAEKFQYGRRRGVEVFSDLRNYACLLFCAPGTQIQAGTVP